MDHLTENGALSWCAVFPVCHRALLASWVLQEHLTILGKLGCVLCCVGSVVLIIHAPKLDNVSSRVELEGRLRDPCTHLALYLPAFWFDYESFLSLCCC